MSSYARVCGFCGQPVEGPGVYIYPVPGDPAKQDNRLGLLACAACGPEQRRLQVAEGLVIPVRPAA